MLHPEVYMRSGSHWGQNHTYYLYIEHNATFYRVRALYIAQLDSDTINSSLPGITRMSRDNVLIMWKSLPNFQGVSRVLSWFKWHLLGHSIAFAPSLSSLSYSLENWKSGLTYVLLYTLFFQVSCHSPKAFMTIDVKH